MPTKDMVRFGLFELDLDAKELRKNGMKIRLSQKPFELLAILLERPGEAVTREELRRRLWSPDVFVDFDHGLNKSIQKLREALGDSADSPRYIETLQRLGYRFIAPVNAPSPLTSAPGIEVAGYAAGLPTVDSSAAATNKEPPARHNQPLLVWLIAAVAVLLITGFAARPVLKRLRAGADPIRSLAVLPLENLSGDPAQEYFADGMTDELTTELASLPGLRVVSRTSAMQNKGVRKPLQQIARELSVDAIVEGSVVRSGDKVRITAQLIDARNDKHLWAQSFEGQTNDLLALQDSVARQIAAQTKSALTPALAERTETPRIAPEAHDAYLRGRYFLSKREADKSAEYFQQAISLAPAYASAYAGLADSLESQTLLGMAKPEDAMPKALAAAKRAIELDPENGEAYSALGSIECTYEWNWEAAGRNLAHGITLSPNYSYAEMRYAIYLDAMGRTEEALVHMRRALELDPLSFLMNRHLGSTLYLARRYDEALYHLRRAGEMEPRQLGVVENWISWIYEKKGMQDEAVDHDLAALQGDIPQVDVARLRSIYRHAGWKAYWQARIDTMLPHADAECTPYDVGVSYLRLGKRDQAFAWLNRALNQRCFWLMWLKVDPLIDDIRTDKRYNDLLKRIDLPEGMRGHQSAAHDERQPLRALSGPYPILSLLNLPFTMRVIPSGLAFRNSAGSAASGKPW